MTDKWWNQGVIYQVYPSSFQDTNGDGVGDLRGVTKRLDHIQALGATIIWLNPIFASPKVDNGYDISDYYQIDPVFGTMADVEELIEETHKRGLKVIFDLVLNHTSDQHPWFQEAIKGKDNPYRDYYIWEDQSPEGHLPNNWASFFGGSVWEKEPYGDQYYFHLFAKEMPDLNWKNPQVMEEMTKISHFWLEKGIDGFRLDAFIHLAKEEGFPDVEAAEGEVALAEEFYSNLENVTDYINGLGQKLREDYPDIFIVGEAASADIELAKKYTDPENGGCDAVITFRFFTMDETLKDPRLPLEFQSSKLDIKAFKETMKEWQENLADIGGPTLYWNNHDMPRMVSRFGDEKKYRSNSSKMLATLMYLQKGMPILLNGEEIGMKNLQSDSLDAFTLTNERQYIERALNFGYADSFLLQELSSNTKSASRGVMQWDDSPFAGFSTVEPWSGVNEEANYTVATQESDEDSIFSYYKLLLRYKKTPLFTKGDFKLLETNDNLYCYERTLGNLTALVCCSFSSEEETFWETKLNKWDYQLLLNNNNNMIEGDMIRLSPYGAVVLVFHTEEAEDISEK
ncbi:alpha-glucosidase [Pisciglobus halotolerans]|uniref:Alpha-glucosidase n=1 Tax=Pisciglobus halotolerans TaxID=745365 RepID=A0A1I3AWE9_9LACT|nr:alpha-glucosidase [Pisciglobus halotolerans]SFH53671.1 alpha-glucosidase [Pisciglobus halotolerans]